MAYFIISNDQGETTIQKVDKEDLLLEIKPRLEKETNFLERLTFMTEVKGKLIYRIFPSHPDCAEILIIKGEIVIPKPIEVVKKFDID